MWGADSSDSYSKTSFPRFPAVVSNILGDYHWKGGKGIAEEIQEPLPQEGREREGDLGWRWEHMGALKVPRHYLLPGG